MLDVMLAILEGLSLKEQIQLLDTRRAPQDDLEQYAEWLLGELPKRIDFANNMLATPGQDADFHTYWAKARTTYEQAAAICRKTLAREEG